MIEAPIEITHKFSNIEPGQIFGEVEVIQEIDRCMSAICTQKSVILYISKKNLMKSYTESPIFKDFLE